MDFFMSKIPAYLSCRNKIWYFYYRIPTLIRKRYTLAGQFIRKSLHTSNKREAIFLSRDYMVQIMTDEKNLRELEESIERHNDMMSIGRKLVDEYNAVMKYGNHSEINDFYAHMTEYQSEAFRYASERIDQEIMQSGECSIFCVTVYASQMSTELSGSRSQLREWAYKHARRRSWLLLERVCEMHDFHTGTTYQSSSSLSSLPAKNIAN